MSIVLVVRADDVAAAVTSTSGPATLRRELTGGCTPDVVVLDARGGDAVQLTAVVVEAVPESPLLVLGPDDDGELGVACLRAGAAGAVATADLHDGLFDALGALGEGRIVFGESAADATVTALRQPGVGTEHLPLTPTQERILSMMAMGATNRVIAGRLGLAEKTVKNYATAIYAALGVANRTEAVALWSRRHALDEAVRTR